MQLTDIHISQSQMTLTVRLSIADILELSTAFCIFSRVVSGRVLESFLSDVFFFIHIPTTTR